MNAQGVPRGRLRDLCRELSLLFLFVIVTLRPTLSPAVTLTSLIPVSVSTIPCPDGGERVLLVMPDLTFLQGQEIMSAKVLYSIAAPQRVTTFELLPVTSAWDNGTASWMAPWVSPGGDFDLAPLAWTPT